MSYDERIQCKPGQADGGQRGVEGDCGQIPETVAVAGGVADYGHPRSLRGTLVFDVFVPAGIMVARIAIGSAGGRSGRARVHHFP